MCAACHSPMCPLSGAPQVAQEWSRVVLCHQLFRTGFEPCQGSNMQPETGARGLLVPKVPMPKVPMLYWLSSMQCAVQDHSSPMNTTWVPYALYDQGHSIPYSAITSYQRLEWDHSSGWVQDVALCHCSSANPIPPQSSLNTWNGHLHCHNCD